MRSGHDSWEGSFWDVPAPKFISANLHLRYRDGAGAETERNVTVRQFGPMDNAFLLIGHCHLRDETRTFRTDRILGCVDTDTGEVVENVAQFLLARYESSPEASLDQLLESDYDALRILLFVGKADGALRAPERAVILEAARGLAEDSRLSDQALDRTLRGVEVPSLQAFRLAVGRLAQRPPSHRGTILAAARAMVGTQARVHPAEQEALDYLDKRLGQPAT